MNKAIYPLFFFAFCLAGVAAEPNPAQPEAGFFTRMRMDYAHRKDFDPAWKIETEHREAIAAYHAKEFKKALELAERWLVKCPVDADMHGIAAGAATSLGDLKSYVRHLYSLYGLLQSVTESGDGLTPATAYKVISVDEEYSLLQEFGAEVAKQSLIDESVDKLECKFPDGATKILYFDASIPLNAMKAQMGGKKL